MTYTNINNLNATSISDVLIYVNTNVPAFMPLVFLALWFVIFLSSYFGQRRLTNNSDPFASSTTASFIVFVVSVLLSTIEGLINPFVVLIILVVLIINVVLLLMGNND